MDVLDPLTTVASSPWAYALVALVAALDALVPAVPSEATLIAAGALAGTGQLDVVLVVLAGAATLAAGAVMPRARFVRLAAAAAATWGSNAGLLGYLGGRTFEEEPWKGIAAGLALAAALAIVVEVARLFVRHGRVARLDARPRACW